MQVRPKIVKELLVTVFVPVRWHQQRHEQPEDLTAVARNRLDLLSQLPIDRSVLGVCAVWRVLNWLNTVISTRPITSQITRFLKRLFKSIP